MLLLLFLINLHSCCFGRLKNSKRLCLFFLFCLALLSLAIDSIDSTSFYDKDGTPLFFSIIDLSFRL